jgi:ABC-2 type transport system permease protein
MIHIFDITLKDLTQMIRDRKTFMFLLIMPIIFTLLFGFASGGFGDSESDSRLPVGFLNQDLSWLSQELHDLLSNSSVIRIEALNHASISELESWVAEGDLAGAVIIPAGYGKTILSGKSARLVLIADSASTAGTTLEAEILTQAIRLDSAVRTAIVIEEVVGDKVPFDYAFEQSLTAWDDPPIAVEETTSTIVPKNDQQVMSMANLSPGVMLQFAIAGLLTAAQIIVAERKTHSLQRLLTTRVRRVHILIGHYLAILTLIMGQFVLLILFGQILLKVNYFRDPIATSLVAFTAALCIAAMGLLIGVFAKNEEQAVVFSLVPMFVLAGLGGAWVPLEVTGETFQAIGHISPVAWAMDGFKNVIIRGFGVESVLFPAFILSCYALLFLFLAAWRLQVSQER